jgi:hypothetical protein
VLHIFIKTPSRKRRRYRDLSFSKSFTSVACISNLFSVEVLLKSLPFLEISHISIATRTLQDERRHLLFKVAQEMFEESKRGSLVKLKDHTIALLYNMVTKMISGRTMYGTASALSDEQRKFRDMVKEYLDCLTVFALQDWFPFTRRFGDLLGTERRMKGAADTMDQHVQSWLDDRRNATANGGSHGKEEHEDHAETKGDFVDTLLNIQGTDDRRCTDSDRKRMIEVTYYFVSLR